MFSLQREKREGHPHHVTGQRAMGETNVFIWGDSVSSSALLFNLLRRYPFVNSDNITEVTKCTQKYTAAGRLYANKLVLTICIISSEYVPK